MIAAGREIVMLSSCAVEQGLWRALHDATFSMSALLQRSPWNAPQISLVSRRASLQYEYWPSSDYKVHRASLYSIVYSTSHVALYHEQHCRLVQAVAV
jgi:hypothetical protein